MLQVYLHDNHVPSLLSSLWMRCPKNLVVPPGHDIVFGTCLTRPVQQGWPGELWASRPQEWYWHRIVTALERNSPVQSTLHLLVYAINTKIDRVVILT